MLRRIILTTTGSISPRSKANKPTRYGVTTRPYRWLALILFDFAGILRDIKHRRRVSCFRLEYRKPLLLNSLIGCGGLQPSELFTRNFQLPLVRRAA